MTPPFTGDPMETAVASNHPAVPTAGEVRPPPIDMETGEPAVAVHQPVGTPAALVDAPPERLGTIVTPPFTAGAPEETAGVENPAAQPGSPTAAEGGGTQEFRAGGDVIRLRVCFGGGYRDEALGH